MMKSNKRCLLTSVTQKLLLPLSFLGLIVTSSSVIGAEAGIHVTSSGDIGLGLLMTVIVSAAVAGLVVMGIVSWARKQDAISNDIINNNNDNREQTMVLGSVTAGYLA